MTTATAPTTAAPTAATPTTAPGADATAVDAAATATATATVTATVEIHCPQDGWLAVCSLGDLTPGRGVAALLTDGAQAALFLDRAGRVHAIGNQDPFTGAQVLSRGLTGSAAGRPFVASPLLKQRFDLATGECLDDPEVSVPAYRVRVRNL